jgi:hypothetical protein
MVEAVLVIDLVSVRPTQSYLMVPATSAPPYDGHATYLKGLHLIPWLLLPLWRTP